ncbi:MAG: ArsC family reductase [Burkholderiales bacterium]|nr:ArsC family reductase [Burkholderiales bacterium]
MRLCGIPNCDTVRKARAWLAGNGIEIPFHDFRKNGVTREMLEQWIGKLGWEALVNRKGTTWRQLDESEKLAVDSAEPAIELMLKKPSVIKRPVLEMEDRILLGFDEREYTETFKK